MLWIQSGICAIFWVIFGLWGARQAGNRALARRPWAGVGLMVLGAFVMFGGMLLLASRGGMESGRLTGLGWVSVGVLGSIFTALQGFGSVWVLRSVAGSETRDNRETSEARDK